MRALGSPQATKNNNGDTWRLEEMKALNVQDIYLRVQFLYEVQEALHSLPSTGPGNCIGALPVENKVFGYAGGKVLT